MVGGTGAVLLGVVIGAAVTALQYMGERSKQPSMQYPSSATLSDIEGPRPGAVERFNFRRSRLGAVSACDQPDVGSHHLPLAQPSVTVAAPRPVPYRNSAFTAWR